MNFRKSPAGCPAGRPYYTRKKLLCIGVKCGYRLVGVLTDGEEDVVAVGHQLIVLYQLQLLRQVLGPLGLQIILPFLHGGLHGIHLAVLHLGDKELGGLHIDHGHLAEIAVQISGINAVQGGQSGIVQVG